MQLARWTAILALSLAGACASKNKKPAPGAPASVGNSATGGAPANQSPARTAPAEEDMKEEAGEGGGAGTGTGTSADPCEGGE